MKKQRVQKSFLIKQRQNCSLHRKKKKKEKMLLKPYLGIFAARPKSPTTAAISPVFSLCRIRTFYKQDR